MTREKSPFPLFTVTQSHQDPHEVNILDFNLVKKQCHKCSVILKHVFTVAHFDLRITSVKKNFAFFTATQISAQKRKTTDS